MRVCVPPGCLRHRAVTEQTPRGTLCGPVPAHIIRRRTKAGEPRYLVRLGLSAMAGPRLLHLGSFKTLKEAEACKAWANMELAQGRIPDRRKRLREEVESLITLRQAALRWLESRVDLTPRIRDQYGVLIRAAKGAVWEIPVSRVQHEDVQAWVVEQAVAYKPATIRRRLAIIKQTLDHAGIQPNPARDRRVRVPRIEPEWVDPPSTREVVAVLRTLPPRYRLPVALLEATGMRVGELLALVWGDVDVDGLRFRIRRGKTSRARRFVPVPVELMALVCDRVPMEDRLADRFVFEWRAHQPLANAMARACKHAGIPRYGPHSLRHRYLSRLVQQGMPITQVQALAGHADANVTLRVYAHNLGDTDEAWRSINLDERR
jgi:integrase